MQISCGNFCPLIKKKCVEHKCSWYTHVRGLNPNTGKEIDEWACSVAWMPVLAIEIAQKENQTGAAVESFRNEMIKVQRQNQEIFLNKNQDVIEASIFEISEEQKKLGPE